MRSNAQLAPRTIAGLRPADESAFAHDVLLGLAQREKRIPCTWLYDRAGSVPEEPGSEPPRPPAARRHRSCR